MNRYEPLMQHISSLSREVSTLVKAYGIVQSAKELDFNIFKILKVETLEEQTHSRILSELLNPKGSHNFKDIFLRLFLKQLQIEQIETENAVVKVEYYLGKKEAEKGGRADLLIKSNSKTILIENKIYAPEQSQQLERYYNSFNEPTIIFLSLYGSKSSVHDDLAKKQIPYIMASYKNDIIEWLDNCIKEAAMYPQVRESLIQYSNLIKSLTGQNSNMNMNNKIAELVLSDQDRFNGFAALQAASSSIRVKLFKEYLFPLLRDTVQTYNTENDSDNKKLELELDEKYFLANDNSWKSFSLRNVFMESKGIASIRFEFAVSRGYNKLIFGYKQMNTLTKEQEQILHDNCFRTFGERPSKGQNGWILHYTFDKYENWDDWNTFGTIRNEEFKIKLKEVIYNLIECLD